MKPILAVSGLKKRFGEHDVLDDVSLEIATGELVAVLGPSGSGKSTLFRCITRLTEPDSGSIEIDSIAFGSLKGRALRQARGRIGVVFQQLQGLSPSAVAYVAQALCGPGRLQNCGRRQAFEVAASQLGKLALERHYRSLNPRAIILRQVQHDSLA